MDTATEALYKLWKDYQSPNADTSEETFEQAHIGQFYGYEALAEHVLYDSGSVDDFWQGKSDHPLAYYFQFDYGMYGRDLDLNGDVYSLELEGDQHYFWTNV